MKKNILIIYYSHSENAGKLAKSILKAVVKP